METPQRTINIIKFVNRSHQVIFLPSKHRTRGPVLQYLASTLELGRDYTEKEVNAALSQWHCFPETDSVRRALVDEGLLARTPDCSRYWRLEAPENWRIG